MTLDWTPDIAQFLEFDGSWNEVIIFNTTLVHRQAVLEALASSTYALRYTRAGYECPLPSGADIVDPTAGSQMTVSVGTVEINCHFLDEEEIRFHFDPREVRDQQSLATLLTFLQFLANAAGLRVVMTPEGFPEAHLLGADPQGLASYVVPRKPKSGCLGAVLPMNLFR